MDRQGRLSVDRVVVLGRGGAGKSVPARRIAAVLDAPVDELDTLSWTDPPSLVEWLRIQRAALPAGGRWVADGDLGPLDDLRGRLPAADTVVLLDHGLARCAWQALRRGRERSDFWRWVLTYRRRWRPVVLGAVREHAPTATRVPVTKRGKLVAYLVPADEPQSNFQRMVAAGQVRLASGDLRDLPPPSPAEPGERLLSDALQEMRDEERY